MADKETRTGPLDEFDSDIDRINQDISDKEQADQEKKKKY